VRGIVRILLPISVVAAVLLITAGAIQNFGDIHQITTLTGNKQAISPGAVASQEAIKDLGTNGGGYFNANSSHPFENPNGFTNLLEIFLLLVIPFSLPRTFGNMVGSLKQGHAILAAMAAIWLAGVIAVTVVEYAHPGTASQLAGGAMEGKEQRFGEGPSSLFAVSTTMTSTGSVNSFHDSFQGLSGGVLLLGMMLGEIAPGGVGSGLYGMLIMAIIAVFLAGLMVGRTPEYLGKKIGTQEIKLSALYILITPTLVLIGTALAMALGKGESSMTNVGAHGFSEVLIRHPGRLVSHRQLLQEVWAGEQRQDRSPGLSRVRRRTPLRGSCR
jgi:K+-transporting ATPase ATPase A chain